MLNKPSLTLKRRLKAPPAQVFSAWTDPKKIVALVRSARHRPSLGLAPRWTCASGAATASALRGEDGEQHEVGGVYREVVPGRRLVFSWAWHSTPERKSLVTITLAPDGAEGTMLTLQHEQFFDEKARDGHERGWTGTLEKLEHYLA